MSASEQFIRGFKEAWKRPLPRPAVYSAVALGGVLGILGALAFLES